MTRYRVTAEDGLNVRTIPTPIGNDPIGALPFGAMARRIGRVRATGRKGWIFKVKEDAHK
jgi:hypothetical protein